MFRYLLRPNSGGWQTKREQVESEVKVGRRRVKVESDLNVLTERERERDGVTAAAPSQPFTEYADGISRPRLTSPRAASASTLFADAFSHPM